MSDSQTTKHMLAQAMKELMAVKPMEKISIGEIVSRCGLNRKSFYYHFSDKYQLVNWIFHTELLARIEQTDKQDFWETLSAICEYLFENKAFYCNALSFSGQNSFAHYFRKILQPIFTFHFSSMFDGREDREFHAVYFADATRVAITRWLVEDACIPPRRFIELIRSAMNGIADKISSESFAT